MNKELHVIVHEGVVRDWASRGNAEARRVLNEIETIKAVQDYVVIPDTQIPELLSSDLPITKPGLKVLVSGAFLDDCCSYQLFHLLENNYDASFHLAACLKGQASPPQVLLRKINQKYPNFYRGYY
ncbi:MAG: hypothetical protein AABW48_00390 [Nanoarchaeota archaeon]